jgi:uncharacterized protein
MGEYNFIMWQDLLAAVALVFVIEGMMPFVKPERWRGVMQGITKQPNKSLRMMGLSSMLIGLGLLYVVR